MKCKLDLEEQVKFGFEHYGIKPDLICCGKGSGGGIAVSGVIGKKK